jgi:hypothetical protein
MILVKNIKKTFRVGVGSPESTNVLSPDEWADPNP